MTENIQKGIISDLLIILRLSANLAVKKLNFQHLLFLTAFLTFGVGDGITAAYMMERHGAGIEANPIVKYLFISHGPDGMAMIKIWFTLMILFAAYVIQFATPGNMYWTINGFLVALTAGGVMAVHANLSAIAGNTHVAPGEVILLYLGLVLVLTEIGSFVDNRTPGSQGA